MFNCSCATPCSLTVGRGVGSLLQVEGLPGEGVGQVDVVRDEEVVEVEAVGHGPQLQPDPADGRHLEGLRVLGGQKS